MKKSIGFIIIYLFVCVLTISAAQPRPEYPRPQFERADWVNLNGEWNYTLDFSGSGLEKGYPSATGFDGKIIVPFCPESKLSGVGYTDFINHIWYQRTINVPQNWNGKKIMLNFGAVYFNSEVYIDGKFVGRHFGGSSSFSFDITRLVTAGKSHNLVVYASNDIRNAKQSAGKQCLRLESYGCNYTRTTGIWQTVWMEAVASEGLQSAYILTDIDQNQLVIQPRFYNDSQNELNILVKDGNKTVAQKTVKATNSSMVVLPIKNAKHWSPESPFLYDITYQVTDMKGKVIDEVRSYAGMRKVHIEGKKIYLNNEPYYQRLVLDQGFYPDGIWTAPSDEALKRDIEISMEIGFNGARLHQKAFEERFYYWADKLGYITWGEAPSWGMDANNIEVARNFITEWSELVLRDRNHPSLLIWTPLNEEFWPDRVQYPRFVEDLYNITKALDNTRPVNTASGGAHIKTDIWTIHHYEQDPGKLKKIVYDNGEYFQTQRRKTQLPTLNIGFNSLKDFNHYIFPEYKGDIPYMIDEFGGIKWAKNQENEVATNVKNQSWGYGDPPRTLKEFYTRLEGQIDALLDLQEHMWGYCYTQLTDVEQEQNGLYYYDRTPKFDIKRIHAIFSKEPQK
ncbi:glycoside hydrolase family 2 protein [Bacteroides sp. 51]|uniref:glycoside hydrolase family 2 protein n=1 Tax=Bacteroides sp. 51 TaxID=2302938 RepID=UPI00351B5036